MFYIIPLFILKVKKFIIYFQGIWIGRESSVFHNLLHSPSWELKPLILTILIVNAWLDDPFG